MQKIFYHKINQPDNDAFSFVLLNKIYQFYKDVSSRNNKDRGYYKVVVDIQFVEVKKRKSQKRLQAWGLKNPVQ